MPPGVCYASVNSDTSAAHGSAAHTCADRGGDPARRTARPAGGAAVRRLGCRGSHHRHRRPAQRRQVDAVQRADQERRARRELPVRHDRAERRRRRRAGPAAGRSWPRSSTAPKVVPATVSFVDIAGIVRGASEGQGLGNKFLANIREANAICQVIRAFDDPDVVHVDGPGLAEGRHRDDQHRAGAGRPADPREGAAAAGEGGPAGQGPRPGAGRRPARRGRCWTAAGRCPAPALDLAPLRELSLLTTKPFLYVFNVDEAELADDGAARRAAGAGRPGRGGLPGRQGRVGADRAARRRTPPSCSPPSARTSRAWTSWPGSASARSACRPT